MRIRLKRSFRDVDLTEGPWKMNAGTVAAWQWRAEVEVRPWRRLQTSILLASLAAVTGGTILIFTHARDGATEEYRATEQKPTSRVNMNTPDSVAKVPTYLVSQSQQHQHHPTLLERLTEAQRRVDDRTWECDYIESTRNELTQIQRLSSRPLRKNNCNAAERRSGTSSGWRENSDGRPSAWRGDAE